jgi:PAS domain S-box-containing protein
MNAGGMRGVGPGLGAGRPLRALLIEDNPEDCALILHALKRGGYVLSADVVGTREEFLHQVHSQPYDIVLADYNLPQWTGVEALELLRQENLDIPLILVTGALGDEKAVESIKQRATDYVLKDNLARLPLSLHRALREKDLREERKRAEAALRDSQARLEATIQTAMDAIITTDEEQRIVVFNAAAEAMFRCTAPEAIGQPVEQFIPVRFRARHTQHVRDFAQTGVSERAKHGNSELRALRADGEEFPMEASLSRAQLGDGNLFTVIVRDVTERKRAEKKLAEKLAELARSNAELEQFAYVASHDLQEPLRMVANYTQLLAERYRGKLDEQADKYIHYAVDGAMRMQAMIQDLLSFSRAGRTENGFHELDLNLAVKLALENLQPAIKESGAVVKCSELPIVKAHRSQIVQLFQNLIGNAIKFRGESAPAIHIRAEEKDGQWTVSIADNGIGIAQEHFDVIFAIFQRLHTRSEYTGNGIGLAICRKIVERHGGRIWVESKEGAGATFKFTLPLTAEASEESGKAASARA